MKATALVLFAAIASLALTACAGRAAGPRAPQHLLCEYRENPLGIDSARPRLSWRLAGNRRGEVQSAYQILAADNPEDLKNDIGSLWDSGKIVSDRSVHVVFDGKPLTAGARYHWKIRVWDSQDRVSPFSAVGWWEMGLLQPDDWTARWIALEKEDKPVVERKGGESYQPPRSQIFRKEFKLLKPIESARAYVSGLGSYQLHINGTRVGDDCFTPGWTEYPRRIQYQTYNVTSSLRRGDNAAAAILGNAWWSGRLTWDRHQPIYAEGPLKLIVQLIVRYRDGSTETIASDGSWKAHPSPITFDSIYDGESCDARLEMPGWDRPGFDDRNWDPLKDLDMPLDIMVAQQAEPIRVTEEIPVREITEPSKGVYVFDLGQNMVGRARLLARGPVGTKVTLRFAEILKDDGHIYTDNLRTAKATDTYILKGDGPETWEPRFTYHGFRYVELTGYPGVPDKKAITGLVLHSAAPVAGEFDCSNELLNRIQRNIVWGQRGNIFSVPTDCPQRDERLGWMGDAQLFAPTACLNMNMARFFTKWMNDMTDTQDENGAVHDISPGGTTWDPAAPAWGDAVVTVPWTIYQRYGDTRIIERNYDAMVRWVDYMKGQSQDWLYRREGYGDWVAPVKSPSEPIGSLYFYHDSVLLSKMAAAIGRPDDSARFADQADKIAAAFNRAYLDRKTAWYSGATQTANIVPLHFGLVPEQAVRPVVQNLIDDLQSRDFHLSTGFIGTAFLLPVLTEFGHPDIAYRVASGRTYPSWGYMVEKGATTIWELWNGDTEGPGMNSRNHFCFGTIGQWFYETLGGIRPMPDGPGYKKSIIRPYPLGDLQWANARCESMYGEIAVRWRREKGKFLLNVTIPANTTSLVHVPVTQAGSAIVRESGKVVLKNGQPGEMSDGVTFSGLEEGYAIFEVGSGRYEFTSDFAGS